MKVEVQIGSDKMISRDLPDLMRWLEKRVSKRKGTYPPEMVLLSLLAGECYVRMLSEKWDYDESPEEFFEDLRSRAREMARELMTED